MQYILYTLLICLLIVQIICFVSGESCLFTCSAYILVYCILPTLFTVFVYFVRISITMVTQSYYTTVSSCYRLCQSKCRQVDTLETTPIPPWKCSLST